MFPLMARDADLVEQAVELADNGVDLLRQVAGVHVGGGVLMMIVGISRHGSDVVRGRGRGCFGRDSSGEVLVLVAVHCTSDPARVAAMFCVGGG